MKDMRYYLTFQFFRDKARKWHFRVRPEAKVGSLAEEAYRRDYDELHEDKPEAIPSLRDWYIARESMKLQAAHKHHPVGNLIASSEAQDMFKKAPPP